MAVKTRSIPEEALAVIAEGEWTDDGFVMPQTDRATYLKVKKALEAIGGKWNKKAQATVFEDEDAETAVREACVTGVYVDRKKEFDFWETPAALADRLTASADLFDGCVVLEPSAGTGAILRAVRRAEEDCGFTVGVVIAVELDEKHADTIESTLPEDSILVCPCDFVVPMPNGPSFTVDRVLMNPPFSRLQDCEHVRRGFDYLKPGGTLVSIMSPAFQFHSSRKALDFRAWFESVDGTCLDLPDGSFKSSGTGVRTVMVTINKPE